jgi:tRNA(Arg) A34 adenosine deaminase TadA
MWNDYMTLAMAQAQLAVSQGDAPFGCIVVDETGVILHSDHDRVKSLCDPSAHA